MVVTSVRLMAIICVRLIVLLELIGTKLSLEASGVRLET
jgi:hypothetical protein